MIALHGDLDGRVGALLPRDLPLDARREWARAAAVDLLDGATHDGALSVADLAGRLENAALDQAPDAIATFALTDPTRTVCGTLRVSAVPRALGESEQRAAVDGRGAGVSQHRPFRSPQLGEAVEAAVVEQAEVGVQYGSVRWLFCRQAGSVLAVLGPAAPRLVAALVPSARQILAAIRPEGLDIDGIPFAAQESRLIALDTAKDTAWDA